MIILLYWRERQGNVQHGVRVLWVCEYVYVFVFSCAYVYRMAVCVI